MRCKPHVRFGGRPGETDRPKCRHRAPGRPHLGLTCVDVVRRRVQQDTLGHRGYADDPLFRGRQLLRRRADRLTHPQRQRLDAALDAGDPTGQVTAAWLVAQHLMAAYATPTEPPAAPPPSTRSPSR